MSPSAVDKWEAMQTMEQTRNQKEASRLVFCWTWQQVLSFTAVQALTDKAGKARLGNDDIQHWSERCQYIRVKVRAPWGQRLYMSSKTLS